MWPPNLNQTLHTKLKTRTWRFFLNLKLILNDKINQMPKINNSHGNFLEIKPSMNKTKPQIKALNKIPKFNYSKAGKKQRRER